MKRDNPLRNHSIHLPIVGAVRINMAGIKPVSLPFGGLKACPGLKSTRFPS